MSLTEIIAALQGLQALAVLPGFIPAALVVVLIVFILRNPLRGWLKAELRFTANRFPEPGSKSLS